MKVVDIHKGRNKFAQVFHVFKENHKFDDFLSAIEFCLKNKIDDCSALEAEWEAYQQNILFDNGMECFSKLLAKIKIEYQPVDKQPIKNNDESQTTLELIEQFIQADDDVNEKRKLCSGKYSWFYPSFLLSTILPDVYPDDLDPGQIIAKYLKTLFPETHPDITELSKTIISKIYLLHFGSNLHAFLKTIAKTVLFKTYTTEAVYLTIEGCCFDILDPENREQRKLPNDIKHLIQTILLAPKDFFYLWNDAMITQLHSDEDITDDYRTDFVITALNMFSFGKDTIALMGSDSKYPDSAEPAGNCISQEFWAYAASERYLSYDDLCSWLFLNCNVAYNESKESETTVKRIIANLTRYRRKYLAGMFPADSQEYSYIGKDVADLIGIEHSDFLIMLTEGQQFGFICRHPNDDPSYHQRCEYLNNLQRYYISLFNKALEEGLSEFAVALLSLSIFYRSIFEKGRFGNFQDLMPAIERALSLPGAKTLKHTLAFVVDSVDTYFSNDPIATCSAAYFRPYIPKPAELHVIEGATTSPVRREHKATDITSFFEDELGSDRWSKLSENSRSCLVSAELQWRNSAVEFGFGIKDWSGLITTYCKAIEGELVDRLMDFYASSEYEAYLDGKGLKRPAKATAGWLLKELRGYEAMPPSLQAVLMNAKICLAGEKDMVNRLFDIVQNYRNISAHHNVVSMKHYAEFKEKLFQSGLLQKFIDAFC